MLRKSNKVEYTIVKFFQVINILNCHSRVYKKLATNIMTYRCKVHDILHERQMRS